MYLNVVLHVAWLCMLGSQYCVVGPCSYSPTFCWGTLLKGRICWHRI